MAKKSKKVSKLRMARTIYRGKRSKQKEVQSRVFSERRETKALSPMVAFKPYTTDKPISAESTAIYSMEYDPATKVLRITFWGYKMKRKGSTYVYYNVPLEVWQALTEASSKGRFFYYNIRTDYNYSRVK